MLLTRSDLNQSAFATAVGIDRSALSQLLSGASTRLPRAETLLNIAAEFKVSLDWLLGLSQDEGVTGEIRESLEIEEARDGFDRTLLAKWYRRGRGHQDPLRAGRHSRSSAHRRARRLRSRHHQQEPSRRRPTKRNTASTTTGGRKPTWKSACRATRWRSLRAAWAYGIVFPKPTAASNFAHMATLLDDLYPTFRLFLYDGRMRYSIPYTIFGPYRAAIYVGDMYLVLNATQPVQAPDRSISTI